jgi:hypothetical protein
VDVCPPKKRALNSMGVGCLGYVWPKNCCLTSPKWENERSLTSKLVGELQEHGLYLPRGCEPMKRGSFWALKLGILVKRLTWTYISTTASPQQNIFQSFEDLFWVIFTECKNCISPDFPATFRPFGSLKPWASWLLDAHWIWCNLKMLHLAIGIGYPLLI